MSYLSDASLVMIPSGVEAGTVFTSKPAGGSADLTFTRSNDTATRVGPNGYIEKVRTNLLLQSNQFDTTWTLEDVSVTSGQSGYDGSNNAWKLQSTVSGRSLIDQLIPLGANIVLAFSVYAKAGNVDFLKFIIVTTGSNSIVTFDLSDGSSISTNNEIDVKSENVGNDWYRLSLIAAPDTAITSCRFEIRDIEDSPDSDVGSFIYIQDAQLEYGLVATDYIETTTAAVSVGPLANVPRINFDPVLPRTGSLLLEPQRTNGLAYSEYFDAWSLSGGTLTANAEVSPQGVENAYLYTEDTSTNYHRINTGASASSSNKVYSVYAKWAGGTANRWFTIDNGPTAWFDIVNGVVGGAQGSVVTSIEDCGNGWYRCIYHNPTSTTGGIYLGIASSDGGSGNHVGNGQPAFYIYGAQCEDNVTYPTSYIPTYGAAATRGNEDCEKANINSLIGGTSGTIFFEIHTNKTLTDATYKQFFYYTDASSLQAYMYVAANNLIVTNPRLGSISSTIALQADTTYKVAIAYAQNDFKLYINGAQVGSSTSGTPLDPVNILSIGSYAGVSEWNEFVFNQFLHFKTRLTNDQLSQITTL